MTVLVMIAPCAGGPESLIMTLSSDEFLFQWDPVGRIRKNLESSKAPSQCSEPIEPLVVNGTKGAVTAIYLCNDKKLMALTHFPGSIWGYGLSKVER